MTKVFIGGSRNTGKLSLEVLRRLDRIVEKQFPVLVGDASGADKAVQQYLHGKGYSLVEVFCAGDECRNNFGGWSVRAIPANGKRKDFSFYATKDRIMAEEASLGLMIWDGKSEGTLLNVFRLFHEQKKVVVYLSESKEFVDLKSEADLERLIAGCTPELRHRLERDVAAEHHTGQASPQANLF